MALTYVGRANRYIAAVLSGEIPAGKWVKLACERQQRDLARARADKAWAFKFDPNDRYLDNGVFAREQPLTFLGPAGLGKSRLVLQLAACTILGRDFLGMKVRSKGLKWLLLQAEKGLCWDGGRR